MSKCILITVAVVLAGGCGPRLSTGGDGGVDAGDRAADSTADRGRVDAEVGVEPGIDTGADGGVDAGGTDGSRDPDGIAFERVNVFTAEGETRSHLGLTGLLFMPEGKGVLVWEKEGRVVHYRESDEGLTFLGEFTIPDVHAFSDCALSAVVLDPDWEENRIIYAAHCVDATGGRVVSLTFDGTN